MAYFPFRAASNRVQNITVTETSTAYAFPNNVLESGRVTNTFGGTTVLFQNLGSYPVYFAWGTSSAVAVAPTWDGTDGNHVIAAGAVMVLSKPDNTNFPTGVTHIAFVRAAADSDTRVSFAVGEGE